MKNKTLQELKREQTIIAKAETWLDRTGLLENPIRCLLNSSKDEIRFSIEKLMKGNRPPYHPPFPNKN